MKMTIRTACAALCAAGIAALSSCGGSAGKSADTISFRKIEVEKSYRLVGSASDYSSPADMSYGCKAELLMPEEMYGYDITPLKEAILKAAADTTGTDMASALAAAMPRHARECGYALADTVLPDSVVQATPNFATRYDGFYSVEGDVETLSLRIMSYAVTISYYLPAAAHGMYGTQYINYNLATGKLVTLADLFTPEGLAALPTEIKEAAGRMQSTIGNTDITALPAGGNFYLTPDGNIVFAYQPYEVASYAQGEIQIPIPGYLLAEYLTAEGSELLL